MVENAAPGQHSFYVLAYTEHPPDPLLAEWIETYWSLHGQAQGIPEPVIPDGRGELVMNLGAGFRHVVGESAVAQPRAIIAGQVTTPLWLVPGDYVDLFGVRFTPSGQSAFLRENAAPLRDRWIDAAAVAPGVDQLISALCDSRERVSVANRWVMERTSDKRPDQISFVASQIFDENPGCSVGSVADRSGVSVRTLERRFAEHVGVTPKEYQRIRRLNRATSMVLFGGVTWSEAAHASGYSDQAHLNHDFKDMTGTTPTRAIEPPRLVTRLLVSRHKGP